MRRALTRLAGAGPATPTRAGEPRCSTYHAFAGRLIAEHGLRIGVEPGCAAAQPRRHSVQLAHRVVTTDRARPSGYDRRRSTVVEPVLALDAELAEHCVEPDGPARVRRRAAGRAIDRVDEAAKAKTREVVAAATRRDRARAPRRRVARGQVRPRRGRLRRPDARSAPGSRSAIPRSVPRCASSSASCCSTSTRTHRSSQRLLLTGLFGGGHPVTAVGDPLQAIYGWRGRERREHRFVPSALPRALTAVRRGCSRWPRTAGPASRSSARRTAGRAAARAAPAGGAAGAAGSGGPRPRAAARCASRCSSTYAEEIAWVADRVVEVVDRRHPARRRRRSVPRRSDFPAVKNALADARRRRSRSSASTGCCRCRRSPRSSRSSRCCTTRRANAALVRLLAGPRWRIGLRDLALLGARAADLAGAPRPARRRRPRRPARRGRGRCRPGRRRVAARRARGPGPRRLRPASRGSGSPPSRPRSARCAAASATRCSDLVHRVLTVTGLDIEMAASPEVARAEPRRGPRRVRRRSSPDSPTPTGDAGSRRSCPGSRRRRASTRCPSSTARREPDAVQLMTVHRSKGLEWPVVVLPSLAETVFPSDRGMTAVDPARGPCRTRSAATRTRCPRWRESGRRSTSSSSPECGDHRTSRSVASPTSP